MSDRDVPGDWEAQPDGALTEHADLPAAPPSNGRDPRTGRFLPGCKGGPGNPFAGRVARLRAAVLDAVSPEDVRAVLATLCRNARNGDVAAAKVFLERALGPANTAPEEPGLDLQEVLRFLLAGASPGTIAGVKRLIQEDLERQGRLTRGPEGAALVKAL